MELAGLIGYGVASIAYLVFILLLLAARNSTITGRLVLFSTILSFFALASALLQIDKHFSLRYVLLFESIKLVSWSLLLIGTRDKAKSIKQLVSNEKAQQFILSWFSLIVVYWLVEFYSDNGNKVLFVALLALNLWLLVLLEQLYRNSEMKAKKALWPLIIGLGSISVFDFILFAQASMLNQLDFNFWFLRAIPAIIAVPFLLISTRRMKNWSVNVFISRDVVFYSSMLMISGLYLLVMSFAGYFINFIGGEWGTIISWAFIVLGAVVLAALLVTERLRREVKVFITKHFFANKYDYRLEWTKLIKQLEIGNTKDYYQTALKTVCTALNIENGLLVKRQDVGCYNMLCSAGIAFSPDVSEELALIDEYCGAKGWIFDLQEYQKVEGSYPELFLNSDLLSELAIEIVVPVMFNHELYGFFLLSNPRQTKQMLNWEDRDLLSTVSMQLSHYISLNEANSELSQAKQFDAFNRMSAFLVHDLKNVQAQLALITTNAEKHKDNPEFISDVFETVESATNRLAKVLSQLRNKQVEQSKNKPTNIAKLLEKVALQCNVRQPKVAFEYHQECMVLIDQDSFHSVMNHLIQNAQEATLDNGWVKLSLIENNQSISITIEDNGCGMSEEFVKTRLFRPFDSTKGNAGMGIGVFEAKQFFESIDGILKVDSVANKGTLFTIELPSKYRI
jgi:putative PEP-CTERM system histidine kinase